MGISFKHSGLVFILALSGCAQPISSGAFDAAALSGGQELEPTITADQYVAGLRKVKGLLLDRPFLTRAEQATTDLAGYQSFVRVYLEDPTAPLAIQRLYQQILQLEGSEMITAFNNGVNAELSIDNNEPAALAAYLFKSNGDFRSLVTANYCVTEYASGLALKADCLHQGRLRRNDNNTTDPNRFFSVTTPAEMRAGAISTQAFLKKYAGALNFRRASMVREVFLCGNYPDSQETSGWTRQNLQLHPFYHTPIGGDQDCQSCHTSLNRVRGFFTGFGTLGEIQMGRTVIRLGDLVEGQTDALTINDVERTLINLPNYESLYGRSRATAFEGVIDSYHGQALSLSGAYPKLSEYGQIISSDPQFAVCTAQRLYNFALGIGQSFLNKLPARHSERLPNALEGSNYNIKSVMVDIFSTTDFLNR